MPSVICISLTVFIIYLRKYKSNRQNKQIYFRKFVQMYTSVRKQNVIC
nr:MAG TPA: hypothetical protein [Caudoviricetes sp.]